MAALFRQQGLSRKILKFPQLPDDDRKLVTICEWMNLPFKSFEQLLKGGPTNDNDIPALQMELISYVEDIKNDLELDEKRKIVKAIEKETKDIFARCDKLVEDAKKEIEKVH